MRSILLEQIMQRWVGDGLVTQDEFDAGVAGCEVVELVAECGMGWVRRSVVVRSRLAAGDALVRVCW